MSIFGIIGIGFAIAFALWVVAMGVSLIVENDNGADYSVAQWFISIMAIAIWIGAVFIGIGIYTEDERLFIARFEAQKQTIEMSLDNENLSGFERVELVSKQVNLTERWQNAKQNYKYGTM
jgi:hypothetical protein